MIPEPGVAVRVAPTQVVAPLAGPATTIPSGRVSANVREEAADGLAVLSMVNVSALRPPRGTELGAKLLTNPGLFVATVRSAVAEPLFPALDVRSPDVLVWTPTVPLVTSTEMLQLPKAPTTPSLNVIVPPPGGALRVPPHDVAAFAELAITTPAGRTSVNARSDTGEETKLTMSNLKVETLPGPIVSGAKVLSKLTATWA
jgi:hypothetical protein